MSIPNFVFLAYLLLACTSSFGQHQPGNLKDERISFRHISIFHDKTYGLLNIYPENNVFRPSYEFYVDSTTYKKLKVHITQYYQAITDKVTRAMDSSCFYCYNVRIETTDSVICTYDLVDDSETHSYFSGLIDILRHQKQYAPIITDVKDRIPTLYDKRELRRLKRN